jgi:hypothetical protein
MNILEEIDRETAYWQGELERRSIEPLDILIPIMDRINKLRCQRAAAWEKLHEDTLLDRCRDTDLRAKRTPNRT